MPRTSPPKSHSPALPGPETITRHELSNGIVVLVRENFSAPSVVIDADLRVGALWHGREQAGLASFTLSALMRGTESRTFEQIYEAIESAGASLGFSSGYHLSGFSGKGLAEDLGLLLNLAADCVRRPVFPADHVEQLRSEILTGMAMAASDTGFRATEAFYELAYPGHPYSVNDDGLPDTIRALTREDLANFQRTQVGPRGLTITIVGAVEAAHAIELVARYFGDWMTPTQTSQPALPTVSALEQPITRQVLVPGKAQSDLLLGGPGPARSHPRYLAARLANNILGVFGMGGRISNTVREKHGLAYYAGTSINGGLGPGAWYAYAGVNPRHVDQAVDLILKEIRRFVTRKVTEEELDDNQAQFVGLLPLSLESNEGVAGAISSMELYGLGLDYIQRYPDLVRAITRDEVLEAAHEFLRPEAYALAVAGPE